MTKIEGIECDAHCGNQYVVPENRLAADLYPTNGWFSVDKWEDATPINLGWHFCSAKCLEDFAKKEENQ